MTDDQWLWAKKQDENGFFKWLPLTAHLRDTRQVAGLLWEHWLNDGVRQTITRSLNEPDEDFDVILSSGKRYPVFLASDDISSITALFGIE